MTSCLLRGSAASPAIAARRAQRGTRLVAKSAEQPYESNSEVGDKLARWLKTPFDLLAFGPRAGAGALVSAPERLQSLQSDLERIVELVQDPRPAPEKQTALLKELEARMVECLERGADVETDVLANIKTVLPPEVANMMTEMIPEPPNKATTIQVEPMEPPTTWHREDVAANQTASEVTEVKNAVEGLQGALEDIRANTDPTRTTLVRLNLREARDLLSRRLNEVSVSDSDVSLMAAIREARILLDEVNAQFFDQSRSPSPSQ